MAGIAISFEGGDGAGKSSVAKIVHGQLMALGEPALFIYPKRPTFDHSYVQTHMETIGKALWEQQGLAGPRNLLGDRHWVHLSSAWFEIIDQHLVRPAIARGDMVILDSWCQKLIARFRLKGTLISDEATLAFRSLTRPQLTFMLDVTPEIAACRKTEFGFAETGNFDGFTGVTRENFILYQTLVRSNLMDMAQAEDWCVLPVDFMNSEEVAERVLDVLALRGWISIGSRPSVRSGEPGRAA